MTTRIGRRRFTALLGSAAAIWPVPSPAQQSGRRRTIGFLMGLENDAETRARIRAFEQGLHKEGWIVGRDIQIEYRYAAGNANQMRTFAKELVDQQPEVIIGHSTPVVSALVKATQKIPIVFVVVSDPIGSGFVSTMARPGGNVTGFTNLQSTITGKYLSILKEMVPDLARVALLYNPISATSAGAYYMVAFVASAAEFRVKSASATVHSPREIESAIAGLGAEPGSGLIVMPDNFTTLHRELIISLAAQWRIPTIYPYRYFAEAGGLMSYGVDVIDLFRRAPIYVSRILRGADPADLPVQAPTKFEFVINLRTARALGRTVPRVLLAGADALIE